MSTEQYFRFARGQKWTGRISPDADQVLTDVTGQTLVLRISKKPGATPLKTLSATIVDADDGIFTFSMSAAETALFTEGKYYWDIWRMDSTFETPIATGIIECYQAVYVPS